MPGGRAGATITPRCPRAGRNIRCNYVDCPACSRSRWLVEQLTDTVDDAAGDPDAAAHALMPLYADTFDDLIGGLAVLIVERRRPTPPRMDRNLREERLWSQPWSQ